MPDFHRSMLIRCRDQFDYYASQHRAKAARYDAARRGCSDEVECQRLDKLIRDTTEKAQTNEALSKEIQESLDRPSPNVLLETMLFSDIVHEGRQSDKDIQSQLGVHFEEVAEMLEQIHAPGGTGALLDVDISVARKSLEKLATDLKTSDAVIQIKDRAEFLDAVCDQIVTGTVSARMLYMNPVKALAEVNRSNTSKLTDGKMARDPETNKWVKGPNYTKPNLRPYI